MKRTFELKDHSNAIAELEYSKWGWNLRFYWIEYRQRNETKEPRHDVVNKVWFIDDREAVKLLGKLGYEEIT